MSNSSMSINGMNINVRNGVVYVDGKRMFPQGSRDASGGHEEVKPNVLTLDRDGTVQGPVRGPLHVTVNEGASLTLIFEGNVEEFVEMQGSGDCTVVVKGEVGGSVTTKSNVTVGFSVGGAVKAGGDVPVGGSVDGPVKAGGDVTVVGSVDGAVKAGGDVTVKGNVHGSVKGRRVR